MYNPKHSTPRRPGRPLSSRKALFALVSVLVLVFAAVGVTVAYLQTQTEPLENQFTPAKVSCKVEETFEDNVKSNVTIQNTGDTDAFIRVAVVANWVQTDENSSVTSLIWGIFSMRQTPSTSRAAGMMATAAFFAPLMVTSPISGRPP